MPSLSLNNPLFKPIADNFIGPFIQQTDKNLDKLLKFGEEVSNKLTQISISNQQNTKLDQNARRYELILRSLSSKGDSYHKIFYSLLQNHVLSKVNRDALSTLSVKALMLKSMVPL